MLYQLTDSGGIIASLRSALKPPCLELVERAERIVENLRLNSYCCEFLRPQDRVHDPPPSAIVDSTQQNLVKIL